MSLPISRRMVLRLIGGALPTALSGTLRAQARKPTVVVVGAGLAGLQAALSLTDADVDVTVLEAQSRVGGRVFTAEGVEGRPEYGASQIGLSYARTIALCGRFGLKLVAEDRHILPISNHLQGQWVRSDQWAQSPLNRLVGDERSMQPAMIGSQLMGRYNRLKDLADWRKPEFADLDVSFRSLLQRHGHSAEALRLAALSTTGNDLDSASMLSLMQEQTRGRFELRFSSVTPLQRPYGFEATADAKPGQAPISNIVGRTSRLTDAMARALGDRVKRGKPVARIEQVGEAMEVTCLDGSRFKADYVISAVPFTLLRRIAVEPGLPPAPGEAVRMLPYGQTTRGFGIVRTPYWEQDGLEPSFFSDGAIKMLWALRPRAGESLHRFMVVLTGGAAERIDLLTPEEAKRFTLAEIARIRPATAGNLELHGWYGWGRDPWIQGCRHVFAPGQVMRLADAMVKPHGRLHFAGEHTRRLEFGMEAALESGERAASEILERL